MDSKRATPKENRKKEPEDSDSYSEKTNSEKGWYKKWRKKWRDMTPANKLTVSFTGVIAFCTFVYAVVSYFQWRALLDSNKINHDALQTVQRAFVYFSEDIKGTVVINPKDVTKINQWQFSIPIDNSGTTPTKGMVFRVNAYPYRETLPANFQYPDVGETFLQLVVLGPKARTWSGPIGVAPEVITEMQAKRMHLYFYGWATYRDVFDGTPTHITKFCYELTQLNGSVAAKSFTTFYADCSHHNCTDDDCKAENPN